MIDVKLLLDDFDQTAAALARRGVDRALLDDAAGAARARRQAASALDDARAAMNTGSKLVGNLLRSGRTEEAQAARARLPELKSEIARLETSLKEIESRLTDLLLVIPNLPSPAVPDGPDETGNQVLRVHGFDRSDYEGRKWRPHFEIASEMGLMDSERSAKLSGSMFSVLVGDGAKLLRGLVRFALEINEPSYLEVMPPHLVRREVMVGSGQLPKFAGEAYQARDDDLWAIPTAEVPLMGLHQNEILEEAALPLAYMAHTNCWRREAGSAGKDTRGMQRLHEFQKVELVRICTPEATPSQLATLLADAERPLAELGLPYRVVALCSGDLGFSSTRTFDLEVYAPGLDRWLEVSSVSAVGDFQARRGRIRLRREASGQIDYVHSLNGSGLATPRVWAALIEHGYREDGTIAVPEALQPYVGKPFLEPACLPGRNLR